MELVEINVQLNWYNVQNKQIIFNCGYCGHGGHCEHCGHCGHCRAVQFYSTLDISNLVHCEHW